MSADRKFLPRASAARQVKIPHVEARELAAPSRHWPMAVWRTLGAGDRAVVGAGAVLGTILLALTIVTVRAGETPAHPKLQEFARNARLFSRVVPHVAELGVLPYAIFACACVLALWLVYLRLIWLVRGEQVDHRLVLAGAVAFGVVALTVPPVFSTDIFSYSIFGRLASVYDLNPYLTTAALGAPGDPVVPYLYWQWRHIPSPYGPLWTLVSEVVTLGRHATPLDLAIRFKVLALGAVLLDGWLIYILVRRRWPEHAGWAYLAFAWNPMVLVEGVVTGHNDALILALVLVSAYLLLQARPYLAFAGLVASGLVKYSTLPLLAVVGPQFLMRASPSQRAGIVARLGAIAALLAVGAFAPYWGGLAVLMSTLDEPGRGVNNPVMVVGRWLIATLTEGHVRLGVPATVALSLAAFGAWQAWMLWRARWRKTWAIFDELALWATSLAVFLLLWPRIHTWYFVVPLGLALAAGPVYRRVYWGILLVSLLSYASYGL